MSLLIDLLRGSNCTLMNKMKKNLQSNILLLPALIAGFFCYLFPILIAFWKSLFLGTGTDFVGIQNYVDLFENEVFSLAVRNLFHLWAIIVPVNLVIGIFIAEVYIKLRKEKLCLFFLVPSILPAACVVTIASSILQKSPSQWGETPVAFYVFLIIVLWKTQGFSILIFIVAIKSIESEIIDAAMLDGVNPLQCFWYIKLPIIKSSLLICGILTIYNSFRCFREAYLIGGSHPNEQLYSIQHFLQNNFMNMNYARLEAASILVVIFVLPCVFLVFLTFDINPDDLWQMDSLMEFICAYKNTAILAIAGVLIQIVIALPAGYAIARIPSPKAQTFFLLTCVFFLLLPQQALMLPQYLVLMNIGWLDSLEGLLIMTAFQPWMILLFWFAAKRIDSSLFDSAICDGASNWVLFRKIYAPIVRPYVMIAAFLSIAESWNLLEQPMTFLQSKERYPLSMILMQLSTDNAELKNVLCLLFAVPLMILFCTMVKKIIDT